MKIKSRNEWMENALLTLVTLLYDVKPGELESRYWHHRRTRGRHATRIKQARYTAGSIAATPRGPLHLLFNKAYDVYEEQCREVERFDRLIDWSAFNRIYAPTVHPGPWMIPLVEVE